MQLLTNKPQPQRPIAEAPGGRPGTHIGLFASHLYDAPASLVMGAHVAGKAFMDALIRHGTTQALDIFAVHDREPTTQNALERLLGRHPGPVDRVHLHALPILLGGFENFAFHAWHDATANFEHSFHLRQGFSPKLYPITAHQYSISYQEMMHSRYLRLLLTDTYPCDSILCPTPACRTAVAKLVEYIRQEFDRKYGTALAYRGRLDVIGYGVDTDVYRPRDKRDMRQQLNLPKDSLILLWHGRFSAADKADLYPLMRVYRDLVRLNPARKLLWVLSGTDRGGYGKSLQEHAASLGLHAHVRFLYNHPRDWQHLLFAACDIFVSPADNIQESFGLTPVEAMACGVPQVVADWDGYRHTFVDGETGFLIPTYWAACDADISASSALLPWLHDHFRLAQSVSVDLPALQAAQQRLITDEELRGRLGERSREHAVAHYSWPVIIRQHESLWQELAAIAGSLQYSPSRRREYFQLPYFEIFSHYASHALPEHALVQLTPYGAQVARGKEAIPDIPGISECLDTSLLQEIVVTLHVACRFRKRHVLDELARDLNPGCVRHPDFVRRHLLWLIKQGLAEVRLPQ